MIAPHKQTMKSPLKTNSTSLLKRTFLTFSSCFILMLCSACGDLNPMEFNEAPDLTELEFEVVEKEKYVLPFTLPYDPTASMHPCLVESTLNKTLSPLMFQSMYELDEFFVAHPVLVDSHTVSTDGTRWVFTIKEGIIFWDGTELTASIVASALNEAKSSKSHYTTRFSQITSITARTNEVTIQLSMPNYLLPNLLDIPISYGGGMSPMGTGPYEYFEGKDGLYLRDYELPLPKNIVLVPTTKEEDLISAFNGGELSLLDGDLTTSQFLGYSGNYQVWEYPDTRLFYLGVAGDWGANIPTLLTMCSQAIDRESLVNSILAGYGTPTQYPIHPNSEMGQALPPLVYDTTTFSERLMKLAQVSFPITLLVNENNTQKLALAQEIANQLSQFNVRINIDARQWDEYLLALETGDYQLYVGEFYLTPDFNLSPLLSSGGSHSYDLRYDSTLEQLWRTYRLQGLGILEEKEEEEVMEHYFQYVQSQVKIVPLFFKNGTMLSLWGHVENVHPVANNLFYQLEEWVFRQT